MTEKDDKEWLKNLVETNLAPLIFCIAMILICLILAVGLNVSGYLKHQRQMASIAAYQAIIDSKDSSVDDKKSAASKIDWRVNF